MVKKRVTPKRKSTKKKASARSSQPRRGDRSRLDLEPLQRHIRKRIKELESGRPAAEARVGEDDTVERLKAVLETLQDICHPTMDIPI